MFYVKFSDCTRDGYIIGNTERDGFVCRLRYCAVEV